MTHRYVAGNEDVDAMRTAGAPAIFGRAGPC